MQRAKEKGLSSKPLTPIMAHGQEGLPDSGFYSRFPVLKLTPNEAQVLATREMSPSSTKQLLLCFLQISRSQSKVVSG